MQLGFPFRNQRGRDVKLIGGQGGQIKKLVLVGLHDQAIDRVIVERQARDLFEHGFVRVIEYVQFITDVLNVVLQSQYALALIAPDISMSYRSSRSSSVW